MDAILEQALRDLLRITTTSTNTPDAIQRIRTTLAGLHLVDPTSLAALADHLSTHGTSVAEELAALAAAGNLLADAFPDQPPAFSLALSTFASSSSSPSSPLDKYRKTLGVAFKMMVEGGGTTSILEDAMGQLRPSISEWTGKMTASAVRWAVGLPKGKTLRPKDLAPLAAVQVQERLDYVLSLAKRARDGFIGREALGAALQEVRPLEERVGGGIQSVAALKARHALEQQQLEQQQQRDASEQAATAAAGAGQDGGASSSSSSSSDARSEGDDAAAAAAASPAPLGQHDETASAASASADVGGPSAGAEGADEAAAAQSRQAPSSAGLRAGDELVGAGASAEEEDERDEAQPVNDEEADEGSAAERRRSGRRGSSPLTPLVSDDDDNNDDDDAGGADSDEQAAARRSSGSPERGSSPVPRGRPTYSVGDLASDSDDEHDARPRKRRKQAAHREPTDDDDDEPAQDDDDDLDSRDSPISPPPPVRDYDIVARTTRLSMTPGPPSFKEPPADVDLEASPADFLHLLTHRPRPDSLDRTADEDALPFSLPTASPPAPESAQLSDDERARLGLGSRASTLAAYRALSAHEREQAVLCMEEGYVRLLQNLAGKLGASMTEASYWYGEATLFQKRSSTAPPSSTSPKISTRADELSRQVLNCDPAHSQGQGSIGDDEVDESDDWVVADEDDEELAAANKAAMDEAIQGILAGAQEMPGFE